MAESITKDNRVLQKILGILAEKRGISVESLTGSTVIPPEIFNIIADQYSPQIRKAGINWHLNMPATSLADAINSTL